jgi:hypothetical protein
LRSAREARELEVDMSLLDVVPALEVLGLVVDDVDELGDVVVVVALGVVVVVVVLLLVLGDVLVLPEVELDGLVEVDELGEVLVELLVPEVLAPVAPVPEVPDIEPEVPAFVSDEPAAFEPCAVAAPVELGSALVPVAPVLCACDTPITAVNDAIAAMVKLFGNLLMGRSPVAE